jgi:hypothetical protein
VDVVGVVATGVEALIAAVVVEVVEVVQGAEDTGAKMMRQCTKKMQISPLVTFFFVRPILLAVLKPHRRRRPQKYRQGICRASDQYW